MSDAEVGKGKNWIKEEVAWEKKIDKSQCMLDWIFDQNERSRYHPLTFERLETNANSPTPFVRVAYADEWGITLKDLAPYKVLKTGNLCGTKGCCNPLHWRVFPKSSSDGTPRAPFWLVEAINGERECVNDIC